MMIPLQAHLLSDLGQGHFLFLVRHSLTYIIHRS
jgi:hypothetical protein